MSLPMCTRVGGRGALERLEVGVDGDELDALDLGLDHAVDGVDAGAADADHAQHGLGDARSRASRTASARARDRGSPAARLGRALEDVLGDVRREHRAQALLGRRHALVAADAPRSRRRLLASRRRARSVGAAARPRWRAARSRPSAAARSSGLRLRHLARGLRAARPRAAGGRSSARAAARSARAGALGLAARPRPSCGRAGPGGPRACSPAYRLPFARTSSAS